MGLAILMNDSSAHWEGNFKNDMAKNLPTRIVTVTCYEVE